MSSLGASLVCLLYFTVLTHTNAASELFVANYSKCVATYLGVSTDAFDYNYSPLYNIINCDFKNGLSFLEEYCITESEATGLIEVGQCIYGYGVGHDYRITINKNMSEFTEGICGRYGRRGTLCGRCKDGWHHFAYSINISCVPCPNGESNWWKLILAAFLPLTLLYILVLFLKINVASSYLQGFILFSQVVSIPAMARSAVGSVSYPAIRTLYRAFGGFCGLWNLDVLRFADLGICLKITSLQVITFDLVLGIYPTLLMILTCLLIKLHDRHVLQLKVLWKPLKVLLDLFDRNLNIKTSILDVFVTFSLLSNIKILAASYDLLAPVKVYQLNSTGHLSYSWKLYYDASVPYFGRDHLPYAILAVLSYLILAAFPVIFLLLYSFHWFQKLLNLFPFRWYIVHTFMDSFQGCYKDGTEPGTGDYRWFASVFFLLRMFLIITAFLTLGRSYFFFAPFVLALTVIFMIQFEPYKPNFESLASINLVFCLLLTVFHMGALGALANDKFDYLFNIIAALASAMNVVYLVGVILHWIYSHRNFGLECFIRVKARVAGYSRI